MDTELARTFLAVVATGNFISAADRLHVTQSTVSARIHALERTLGCILFVRNRGGTTLTAAGRQFQKHASTLVRTVEQARTSLASTNPQGRFIQPKEVAAAVLWLCSEAAGSVTGQALSLSGGETW